MDEHIRRTEHGTVTPSDEVLADAEQAAGDPVGTGPTPPGRPNGPLRTIVNGGAWNTFGQIVPILINIALTPYVIHGFGTARFGVYLVVVSITTFLSSFDGGIGASAGRYFAVYAGTGDRLAATRLLTTLSGIVAVLGGLLVAVLVAGSHLVLSVFDVTGPLAEEATFLFRVLGAIVGFSLLRNLFVAQLRAHHRYALPNLTNLLAYVVYALGLYLSVRLELGLRGMALTFAAQSLLSAVVLVPASFRYLDRRGIGLLGWAETTSFLRFSLRVQSVGLSNLVSSQIDTYVVGAFLGVRQVTYYSAGSNFAFQLRSVPINAIAPIATIISRAYGAGGDEQALREFIPLQRLWVRAVAGWSAAGLGAAYFGVTAWLGPDFSTSGTVAVILVLSNAVNLWTANLTVLLQSTYRAGLELRYSLAETIGNIALTIPLVALFGLYGTVAASGIAQVAGSLYLLRLVRRRWTREIPSFVREVPVLATLLTVGVTVALELLARPVVPSGALGLLVCGALAVPGIGLYAVLVFGAREVWRRTAGTLAARRRARASA